jgi:hypothetical protein
MTAPVASTSTNSTDLYLLFLASENKNLLYKVTCHYIYLLHKNEREILQAIS